MKKHMVLTVVVSILFVTISPLITPSQITNNEQLDEAIHFGKPIYFVEQKINITPLSEDFPIWVRMQGIWENPTQFIFTNYAVSILITNLFVLIFYKIIFRKQ